MAPAERPGVLTQGHHPPTFGELLEAAPKHLPLERAGHPHRRENDSASTSVGTEQVEWVDEELSSTRLDKGAQFHSEVPLSEPRPSGEYSTYLTWNGPEPGTTLTGISKILSPPTHHSTATVT